MTRYNDFSDEELSKLISEKQAYINKMWEEATLPWQDYVEEVNKTNIWEMEVELNNRRVPILRDTDEFEQECRETYKSFKQSCKFHCIPPLIFAGLCCLFILLYHFLRCMSMVFLA